MLYLLFMSHLLHLDSSLRTGGSRSRKLSAYYAERWRAQHPGGTVTYRDLAADPIPHLDHTAFSARFTAPADHTPEQAAASATLTITCTMLLFIWLRIHRSRRPLKVYLRALVGTFREWANQPRQGSPKRGGTRLRRDRSAPKMCAAMDIASSMVEYCVLAGYLTSKLIFPISLAAVVPMQFHFIIASDERFLRILWCLFDGFSREVDKDL